jgi:uncharacterized protein
MGPTPTEEEAMPRRDSAPIGAPCWIELFTGDTDAAESFYGELFGWTAQAAGEEFGGYINFHKDGVPVAGCMRNDGSAGVPDLWSTYLATDDAKALADAVVAHGGQVMVAPMDVMDLGTMAVFLDTGGASIGAWQPGLHKGFGLIAEPGAPAWFELHTRAYDASVAFYRDVFGWDTHVMSDTPEFRYTTLGEGTEALAGIMDAESMLPEGASSRWVVYLAVADADATVAAASGLGGAVVDPPVDTPYGRMATLTDRTGAAFKVVANT